LLLSDASPWHRLYKWDAVQVRPTTLSNSSQIFIGYVTTKRSLAVSMCMSYWNGTWASAEPSICTRALMPETRASAIGAMH
jgi:hypothetical protein